MNQTREEKEAAARVRLAELTTRFLIRTESDLAAMRADLSRAGEQAEAIGTIRHLAHRMVGTGATLGFESISECAHRVELLAESCAPGTLPDERTRVELAGALDALEAEYRRQRS
jgi:chemotaxis protein histidine kinase CheA